jgi:hypothetical protein
MYTYMQIQSRAAIFCEREILFLLI